jgi:thiol-disulfide isomerase/thioredoxin
MRILTTFFLLNLLFIYSCKEKPNTENEKGTSNTVIIGSVKGYHPKLSENVIQLFVSDILKDDRKQYLAKIDYDGGFTIKFFIHHPQETMIRYSGKLIGLMSFPDDTAQIEIQVNNLDGYQPNIELVRAESKKIRYGNYVNDIQKFSMQLSSKYSKAEIIQDSFDNYYKLILQKKEEKWQYLDSLTSINPDLDSILVVWTNEHIEYGFKTELINYYSINRMLNRSSLQRDNISEAILEKPIDIKFQTVCDSVLSNIEIGNYESHLSASYDYFLNSLSAYDNYQFGRNKEEDYLMKFKVYLQNKYDRDDFELIFTRFLYSNISGLKTHRDHAMFTRLNEDLIKQIIQDFDENYQMFLTEELRKAEEILKSSKPQAIKYDLAEFPEVEKFWESEVLKKNRGKVLYIKLWAPWCGPCMANWQSANNLVKYYTDKDFSMINLCIDTPKKDWEKTIKKHKITGIHYLLSQEQSSVLLSSFGINGIPFNLLTNKEGQVIIFDAMTTGTSEGKLNQSLIMQIDELLEI